MDTNPNDKSKQELLKELEGLGVLSNGRKSRSDKGKTRGPNSKVRSDKGTHRIATYGVQKSPRAIYAALRARLLNREITYNSLVIEQDINSIFMPAIKEDQVREGYYSVVIHGVKKERTIKHIKGYSVDLERYRFEALQDLAAPTQFTEEDGQLFKQEIFLTRATTYLDLFCRLYHVREEDYLRWTYKHWKEDYLIVCDELLDNEFTFNLEHHPGSSEFMPEYASKVIELQQEKYMQVISSKEFTNMRARVRDLEISKVQEAIKSKLLEDPLNAHKSLAAINREAREKVDMGQVDQAVEEFMTLWLRDKAIFDNDRD